MYGQGNFDPQFKHGPPTRPPAPAPLPPLRQTPLAPPIHQGSPQPQLPPQQTPPPPPYPQLPLQPPPPAPANMGQTYFHLPPLYNPPGPSYSHIVPQPVPPPPRVFMMPRPPPHGQVMYRAPPPPPLGRQHLPAPPPPHPSGFVSVTPATFASNEALPPSLPPPPPPPPPPPSSPPPLPPSPPPPVFLILGHDGPSADKAESHTKSEGDDHPPSLQVPNGSAVGETEKNVHVQNGETFDVRKASLMDEGPPVAEKKVSVVKGDTLGGLPPSPPKPHDEEVVKNIEALCQLIQKYGPTFEEEARMREAGNPCFSFLFGGQPGSASAIGHAYFQWMKTKCRLESKHHEDSEYVLQSAKLEDEGTAYSPADSDMDMDDDASHPDEDKGLDDLNRNSEDSDVHVVKELLPATQDTARQLEPEIYSSFGSCSGSLKLEDNKGARDGNVQASIKSSSEDVSLDKGLPSAASCKSEELPRVFVKDGSPFCLIQGYASDDSGEDDKGEEMINVTPIRASTTAAIGFSGMNRDEGFDLYSSRNLKKSSDIEISCETKTGLSKPSPPIMTKAETSSSSPRNSASITAISPCPHNAKEEGAEFGSHQKGDNKCDHRIAPAESSQHSDSFKSDSIYVNQQIGKLRQEEDAKEDSPSLAVDEFGRLLRKAASDSDSDGVDYRERSMKRGRSRSHSLSPQHNRRRRMSRSPRRREKRSRSRSWSPKRRRRSRSRSPPTFRRTSEYARRGRDQPPECVNFIRGRCFRGASCRFIHRDFGRSRGGDQEFHETLQKSRNTSRNDAPSPRKSHQDKVSAKEMDVEGHHNREHEAKNPMKDDDLDKKAAAGSKINKTQLSDAHQAGKVAEKGFSELDTPRQEAQEDEEIQEALNTDRTKEEGIQSLPFQRPPTDSLPDKLFLSEKSQGDVTSANLDGNVSGASHRLGFCAEENPLLQVQWNAMQPASNSNFQPIMRSYLPGKLTRPHGVDIHPQPSRSMDSSHQTPFHADEFRQRPMPVGNWSNQPIGREDRFARPPILGDPRIMPGSQRDHHLDRQSFSYVETKSSIPGQGYTGSSSFLQANIMHPHLLPVPRDSLPNQPYSVTGFCPPQKSSSWEEQPYSHNPGLFTQQQPSSSTYPSNMGSVMVDSLRHAFSSSNPESKLPPHLSDMGVTKISAHYNPFASTFEQPLPSLQFASTAGAHGSKLTASPPNPRRSMEQFLPRGGGVLPEAGDPSTHAYTRKTSADMPLPIQKQFVGEPTAGDAYDPLFDSIEPFSSIFRKLDASREQLVNDATTLSKSSIFHKSEDIEDNDRQKSVSATVLKSEADELGEVATDAEVGDVENASPQPENEKDWSPGVQLDVGNTTTGEIEIDQVQTPGRSKKSKDSRSMRLFKIALADFVKEVLKPSWRQGNMSKEAFKTIVKKTVDKVSGAMSSHHIPKTQAKINQYVESSQRKLTKLVMGYVDKYVKM